MALILPQWKNRLLAEQIYRKTETDRSYQAGKARNTLTTAIGTRKVCGSWIRQQSVASQSCSDWICYGRFLKSCIPPLTGSWAPLVSPALAILYRTNENHDLPMVSYSFDLSGSLSEQDEQISNRAVAVSFSAILPAKIVCHLAAFSHRWLGRVIGAA